MANYGSATMEQDEGYFHPFAPDGYYRRLDDGMDMSVESVGNSNCGGSMTMSVADSSVGSNNSRAAMLMHQDLRARDNSSHAGHSVANNNNAFRHNHNVDTAAHNNGSNNNNNNNNNNNHNHNHNHHNNNNNGHGNPNTGEDVLAVTLMDLRYPTKGLPGYEKWTIDLRKLTLGPAFAQGAFGRLYRGTYNGIEDVAVKILERPENNLERAHLMEQQYSQEVMMLAALKHQNVVRLVGACHKRFLWCIATEYAKGGSVRAFLAKRQNRAVPLKLAVKQALDVARGMEYLHSLGFIHRDLKSDNLLISADKAIKIADFGVARIEVQTEGMTPETGTYRWMAPEMIQRRDYSHKVDVYSFGIVLWELITGNLPFSNMTAVQAAFAVVNKGVRPVIPPDCPVILAQIMSKCWDANPDVRPAFSQVVQLLEEAQTEIVTTVGKARFRCGCLAPLTFD